MRVRFKGNRDDLTRGNIYRVIGIEGDWYRIMNDHGQPYLYDPALFRVVDSTEPPEWRSAIGQEGERYAYPPALGKSGFFEDYFDGDRKVMATLHEYLAGRHELPGTRRRRRAIG